MGFRNLLLLKQKEYRIYLILIIWLLVGFTLFQFEVLYIAGYIVFFPLIVITFILFLISIFSFKTLRDMSRKRIIISFIIFILLILLFINFFFALVVVLFFLAIISYILITTVFTMYYFYVLGVKIDNYLYKLPSSLKNFERWCFFLGGTILSIILLIGATIISEVITGGTRENVGFNTAVVAIIIVIIITFFGIIGALHSRHGRLYAWMGIFFVWVAIYSIYLMISIIYSRVATGGTSTTSIPVQILLYLFSLFLLLNTIGGLIAEKAEVLKAKLRIFSSDTILIWLIFSVASFEFGAYGIQTAEIELFRYIVVYVLFIPLLIIMTYYGIRNYSKISKERSILNLEKEAKREGVIEATQKICRECGAVNNETNNYCDKCGAQLN
ncbi:MAG: zinc ribbon domain-containing protein [Promethearchaeota archaeon]|nr:MAG: zinc ribbon domain-containing protein [Candidatus Lokiarchaeota archaeon]